MNMLCSNPNPFLVCEYLTDICYCSKKDKCFYQLGERYIIKKEKKLNKGGTNEGRN